MCGKGRTRVIVGKPGLGAQRAHCRLPDISTRPGSRQPNPADYFPPRVLASGVDFKPRVLDLLIPQQVILDLGVGIQVSEVKTSDFDPFITGHDDKYNSQAKKPYDRKRRMNEY